MIVTQTRYQRSVEQLGQLASMFWPEELCAREAEHSIIPKLIETQDQFITILALEVRDIEDVFNLVDISTMPANLFLKHLAVLSDFGGEMLQRINAQFESLFPTGQFDYFWNGENRTYVFKELPVSGQLSNTKLGLSGRRLLVPCDLTDVMKDVICLLILGASSNEETVAQVFGSCEIGSYLGDSERIATFLKQRYIWVSRITGGAKSNSLGQIAQDYVKTYLEANIGIQGVVVSRDGNLPNVSHTDEANPRLTTFDLVVSDGSRFVGVEVSFQVTTNSVIERKSGQARSRFEQIERAGHKIAYVLDGAGNFQRINALNTICSHSHCTVAFSQEELQVLCEFIREYFLA